MNILIPTDLSEASFKTLPNVIDLFKEKHCTLTFFHAVEPRTGGSTLVLNVDDIIYQEAKTELEDFISKMQSQFGTENITLKSEIAFGYFETVLNRVLDRTHPDIVIMVSKSRNGIDKILERKQSLKFIGEIKQPLLIIPHENIPEKLHLMGVAIDQKEPLKAATSKTIEQLAEQLTVAIELFHVYGYKEGDLSFYEKKMATSGQMSKDIQMVVNEDVAVGMEEWMSENNAEILTLITHNKNFLSKLLTSSMTKVMTKRNANMLLIITQ